jgi:hypothetical protein
MEDEESRVIMQKDIYKQFQKKWRRDLKTCRNYGLVYIAHNYHHQAINANYLKDWSHAIQKLETIYESPPLSISFMPESRHRKRKNDGYNSDLEESHNSHQKRIPHVNVHVHQNGDNSYIIHSSDSNMSLSRTAHSRPIIPRSSPPIDDIIIAEDPVEELREYMDWQIKKVPGLTGLLREAHEELKKESLELKHIQKFKDDAWKVLNIRSGIGKCISGNIKAFWIFKGKKRRN